MSDAQTKVCQSCKEEFRVDANDRVFYEKIQVPEPTFCPECRLIRRFTWRNERALYKRTCGLCKKDIISVYSPDEPYVVYCNPCWWSDNWDMMAQGREYDFTRPFFEQLNELHKVMPLPALQSTYQNLVNSEYTNLVTNLKNCYLLFNSDYDESCSYGTEIEHSKECYDNMMLEECELSYGNVNCEKCFNVFFSTDLESCHDVWFSKNLSGCSNCFGCVNLRKQKYHIFNEPYSKEEYEQKIGELYTGSHLDIEKALRRTEELFVSVPYKYMHGRQNENVAGDYVTNSKDTLDSFVSTGCWNCRYCQWMLVKPVRDCWDYTEFGDNAERVYEFALGGLGLSDVRFSAYCFEECARVEYSTKCYTSTDLFGCVSLRKQKYCILNKQYTEEEYKKLLPKVREHMNEMPYTDKGGRIYTYGEFFPPELSPWAYNETSAQEFAPLTKSKAEEKGYRWRDAGEKAHNPSLSWREVPLTIKDVKDDILKETILCRAWNENEEEAIKHNCSKAFRITEEELAFYRRVNIPIPEYCPNSRHHMRLKRRNPFRLWSRQCMCDYEAYKNGSKHEHHPEGRCPNKFETSYSPDGKEIVYCETCYKAEVL